MILWPPNPPIPVSAHPLPNPDVKQISHTKEIQAIRWGINGRISPGFALYFPGTDTVYATKEFPEQACELVAKTTIDKLWQLHFSGNLAVLKTPTAHDPVKAEEALSHVAWAIFLHGKTSIPEPKPHVWGEDLDDVVSRFLAACGVG